MAGHRRSKPTRGPPELDAGCIGYSQATENTYAPADIIVAVDNSGSMTEEAGFVRQHMGSSFSSVIVGAGIDAHVVFISADESETNGICIDAPLGSGSCPGDDNPPSFLHVKQEVGSRDALQQIIDHVPTYQHMLRPDAAKHVVVISDDDSMMPAFMFDSQFRAVIQAFDPGFVTYSFHAIYAFTGPGNHLCAGDPCCGLGARAGAVYEELVKLTSGVEGNLCLQDFAPVFDAVSQQVVSSTPLACEWEVPDPPAGEELDPTLVNVEFRGEGHPPQELGHVASEADCSSVQLGWYYDDPAEPSKVHVCPDACSVIQGIASAQIDMTLGCATRPAIPR